MKYIIFDSLCPLCTAFIKYLSKKDVLNKFTFLEQNQKDLNKLTSVKIPTNTCSLDSIIFVKDEQSFILSNALIQIFLELPFPDKLFAYILYCIPKPIRDFSYKRIAKNRQILSKYF